MFFENLLNKYQNYVFKISNKHVPYEEVEDIAQEVFVKAYKSLGSFQKKKRFPSLVGIHYN